MKNIKLLVRLGYSYILGNKKEDFVFDNCLLYIVWGIEVIVKIDYYYF